MQCLAEDKNGKDMSLSLSAPGCFVSQLLRPPWSVLVQQASPASSLLSNDWIDSGHNPFPPTERCRGFHSCWCLSCLSLHSFHLSSPVSPGPCTRLTHSTYGWYVMSSGWTWTPTAGFPNFHSVLEAKMKNRPRLDPQASCFMLLLMCNIYV